MSQSGEGFKERTLIISNLSADFHKVGVNALLFGSLIRRRRRPSPPAPSIYMLQRDASGRTALAPCTPV